MYKHFLFFFKVFFFKKYHNKLYFIGYHFKNKKSTLECNKLIHFFGRNNLFIYVNKTFLFFNNFIKNNFSVGYNVLFVDYNYNYNYIPILNRIIFSRSLDDIYKYIKLFNVNVVLLFDVNKKKFVFRKLSKFGLIYISTNSELDNSSLDLNLGLSNSPINNYIVYTLVINSYIHTLNCKNLF